MHRKILFFLFALFFLSIAVFNSSAQGTAFTYQGQLNDSGAPANARYNFRFSLFNTLTGGAVVTSPKTNSAVLVTNGLFTVTLDFGAGIFTGTNYWLEVAVCPADTNDFVALAPRQPLLPTPYAIFASGASNLLGSLPASQLSGTLPSSQLSGNYSGQVNFANGANSFSGTFSGNGNSLSNLNASQLASGTVADARLSTNVALLNASQTFTGDNIFRGAQTFSGANNFTNLQNSFSGSFFGNGLVGWIEVTGTSTQAISDAGYLLLNSNLTTVTLPASPGVGDIVRISGAGAGGWKIAQNGSQTIFGNFFTASNSYSIWSQANASSIDWQGIASSASGIKMVAVSSDSGAGIYTSTDSGKTWNSSSTSYSPTTVASSADGTTLVAAIFGAGIVYSLNSGVTWSASTAPSADWQSIACSADGKNVVAVVNVNTGRIYTSANSGATWTLQSNSPNGKWYAVSSSANGAKLVAAIYGGKIYTSANSGVNWTVSSSSSLNWTSLASSADGTKVVATVFGGGIYTSSDSGATWTQTSAPAQNWYSVTASSDGGRLAACAYTGGIYLSANSGATWIQQSVGNNNWRSIAGSADGSKLAAVFSSGGVGGIDYWNAVQQPTTTTVGTAGSLTGAQGSAVELQYIGNNQFMPVSSAGVFWAN